VTAEEREDLPPVKVMQGVEILFTDKGMTFRFEEDPE
jgi:hypothetical protein